MASPLDRALLDAFAADARVSARAFHLRWCGILMAMDTTQAIISPEKS